MSGVPFTRAWITLAKIAWRESKASAGKFAFVILAVAIGVGALSGVRGFSSAFRQMLLRDARMLMAADLSVRAFHIPDPGEQAALDRIVDGGAERTWITETASMMTSEASSRPLMVSVKAVDPEVYPFYGEPELRPVGRLADVLDEQNVVVSDDLLLRLGVEVGDRVKLGKTWLRIAAVLAVEPDRMTGSFNIGPRVMLSREALDASGLIARGSRAAQRYLYKLPEEGIAIPEARAQLEAAFPKWAIADFRETNPTIRRGLDRATDFLSLVSLAAMIVGAMGVGMAMHSHLQQRLDSIAVMKCLGARSGQILRIYLLQTLGLGIVGSFVGAALGFAAQAVAPSLIAQYFPTAPDLDFQPEAAVLAGGVGVLTTLLFALPPLLSIRKIRPALVFRREMESLTKSIGERLREWGPAIAVGALILAALGGVAALLGDSTTMGVWFAGGLLVSVIVLSATASLLLGFLRRLPGWLPFKLPVAWRHGLANLHRPGAHAAAILVALGVGVTFTLSVYLIQTSVLDQMAKSAPPEMPNVFLNNITNQNRGEIEDFLGGYPGVEDEPVMIASVPSRLIAVNGRPLAEMDLGDDGARYRQTRGITWADEKGDEVDVLAGRWWEAGETAAYVAVRERAAETLGVGPGDRLQWTVGGRELDAEVRAVVRVEGFRTGGSANFILTRAALEGLPANYFGGVRIDPEKALDLQRDAFERFPTVMVINAADVIAVVQEVVDQIAVVVQFVSGFAILGGIVILTSSVLATRFRRVRETAVLKTLGATKRRISAIFSVEFLVLGATAGLIGALLASGFSMFLLERVLDAAYAFDPVATGLTVFGTALLANAAGWLGSFRILDQKPLEVLRGE